MILLLIVPVGIEIRKSFELLHNLQLLIVPVGIEIKTDMGYDIFPRYQDGSLWRLRIKDGVGNFTIWGNKFDNPDTLDWLEKKQEWFKAKTRERWQNFTT